MAMLTLKECLQYCNLTEEEIEAIAEHEHIPEIVAAEMAEYLVQSADGVKKIRHIIFDDIRLAKEHGDIDKARNLETVLKHFIATHPERNDS
jgi:hemerythrin